MIPSATEIASSVYGAWRLARLDPSGMQYFNRTVRGFWNSFFVALLILPAYVYLITDSLAAVEPTSGLPQIIVIQGLVYILAWTAFPLVMFHLAEAMGRSGEYIGYIVAANWISLLEVALDFSVTLIGDTGLLPETLMSLASAAVFVLILAFEVYVAHTALRIGGMAAAGVVLLALFLFYLINGIGLTLIT